MKTLRYLGAFLLCAISALLLAAPRAQAQFGNALSLNGVDQHVAVPAAAASAMNTPLTVEAWVYVRSYANWSRVIDFCTQAAVNDIVCVLSSYSSGQPALYFFDGSGATVGSLTSPTPLPLNTWTHLAFTADGANASILVNGNAVVSGPMPAVPSTIRTNNFIGRSNFGDAYANAIIDEFRIWSVARSPAQIQANMGAPLAGNEAGLLLYYRFDSTSGTVATNSASATGAAYNGTLVNSPAWVSSYVVSPYSQAVLADHPIGYWRLDETNGTVARDYFGANSGFYTNALLGQPGNTNLDPHTAVKFGSVSNVNSYVGGVPIGFATANGSSATFSVECWVNGGPQINGIITRGTGGAEQFCLDCGSARVSHAFRFFIRDAAGGVHGADGNVVPDNTWHHLAGVCDQANGKATLYVDGISNASVTITPGGGLLSSANATTFGSRQSGAGAYDLQFVGSLEEVAIYTNALSAARVLAHYQAAATPGVTTLPATSTTPTNATLNGTVNPNGSATSAYFRYGLTTSYGSYTATNALVATNTALSVSNLISNLTPASTYHFQLVAYNSVGASLGNDLTLTTSPYGLAVLADHPIGYWRLDETNGTVARDYFGANSGFYTNALLGQPANTNVDSHTAVKFGSVSNVNSYVGGVPIGFATAGYATFSVECWANGGPQTNDSGIITHGIGGGEQFSLDCGSAGHAFRFLIRDKFYDLHFANGTVAPDNTWHHLVGVCDQANGKVILYVDGIPNASSYAGAGLFGSANATTFGSRQSGAGAYDLQFVGSLEEVAIYTNALSAAQVLAHYQAATAYPPVATTLPATSIAATNATLNGTVNPNGAATTAFFRYGLTTNYGSYSATNALAATNTNLSVSTLVSNLTTNTTYHFQLVASNIMGSGLGADLTFTTLSVVPTVTTLAAGGITPTNATLNGSVNPNGAATMAYFRYGLTTSYGSYTATNALVATNTALSVTNLISNLTPATTYHFQLVASNSVGGASLGDDLTLTTPPTGPPTSPYGQAVFADHPIGYWRLDETNGTVARDYFGANSGFYTNALLGQPGNTNVDSHTAVKFGSVSNVNSYVGGVPIDFATANGGSATFSIECWANGGPQINGIITRGTGGAEQFCLDCGSATASHAFRFFVRDAAGGVHGPDGNVVLDNTWHHLVGVCDQANGKVILYVDGISNASATITPGSGLLSSANATTFGSRQSGGGAYDLQFVGSLEEVAIYTNALSAAQVLAHYQAATAYPPVVTTLPASITAANATLNGTVNPNGAATTAFFRYGLTTNYGNYSATNALAATNTNLSVSNLISDLTANTYHFQLVASNIMGSGLGADLTFTIEAAVPTVTTLAASGITPTNATLNGTVNPNGAATTAYFRYGLTTSYGSYTTTNALNTALSVSNLISNLTPGTTYHFQLVASNSVGASPGNDLTLTTAAASPPTSPYGQAVLADHPIGYWRLDETNGTVARDYFGANSGFYTNALLGQAGNTAVDSHTAVKFGSVSNVNSYVGGVPIGFATANGGNATFSVECWANGGPQINGIITRGTGGAEQFCLDCGSATASQAFRFFIRDAAGGVHGADGNVVLDNTWHHLVGVCDQANGKVILYVDGISNASATVTPGSGLLSSANATTFGSRQFRAGPYDLQFVGSLEEVAIYTNALSAAQVLAHYQAATPPPPPVINSSTLLSNGAFQLTFTNPNNIVFSVLGTANLNLPASNWTVLGATTNIGGGRHGFTDSQATNFWNRYYLLRFP